ncbi:hypothetical protein C8R47DRAFT_35265 [Mycena vitilis]|nr:hypothetical protein C8R47DRAFT_35265 [Mycena vitilis]
MENPIVHEILQFLCTDLQSLTLGEKYLVHDDDKRPQAIVYDHHMPPWLRLQSLRYDPSLSSKITDQFVESLAQRKAVKDGSMTMNGLALISMSRMDVPRLVPRMAVSEWCVKRVQMKIHMITGRFATLAAFDVDNSEIDQLLDVFTAHECPESNMKADSLVGCGVEPKDHPEQWGSLWSSLTEPRDLRHPHFKVLYTEEYKDIIAGNPRTILGIYVIIWCLEKGHLETFWPEGCHGCPAFVKSHQAEQEATDDSGMPHDAPVDSPVATENLVNPNLEALEEGIGRLITLADVYDERYNIPKAEREDEDMDDEEPTAPAESTEYEHILEGAMNIAIDELNLPPAITDGLLRSMLDAAYFLIQVRDIDSWFGTINNEQTGLEPDGTTERDTCPLYVSQSWVNHDTAPSNSIHGGLEIPRIYRCTVAARGCLDGVRVSRRG